MLDPSDTEQPSDSQRLFKVSINEDSDFARVCSLGGQNRPDHAVQVVWSVAGYDGNW